MTKKTIGEMRHRVNIMGVIRTPDEFGGYSRNDTVIYTVFADITPISEKEIYKYKQLQQAVSHEIRLRYRTDIRQGGTLINNNDKYYIQSVVNYDKKKRFIVALCREGGIING